MAGQDTRQGLLGARRSGKALGFDPRANRGVLAKAPCRRSVFIALRRRYHCPQRAPLVERKAGHLR